MSHFLIHFHVKLAKQEGPSSFLLLYFHRQETGNGNTAWSRHQCSAYISHCSMLFQNTQIWLPLQGRQTELSTQKQEFPLVAIGWCFLKQYWIEWDKPMYGKRKIIFTFSDICKLPGQQQINLRDPGCSLVWSASSHMTYQYRGVNSCTCTQPHHRCRCPGWGRGWRHIRWC